MRRAIFGLATLAVAAVPALAGHNADSTLWSRAAGGLMDSGWVVQFPTQTSDYFDTTYDVIPGNGNVESPSGVTSGRGQVAGDLPISGIAVSVTDFGSGRTYATVGVFRSNLGVDPSGETPDLSAPISAANSPALTPPPLFQFVPFELPENAIPAGDTRVHAVGQLPPGDSGLLGIGADSGSGSLGSGFTTDGYATPTISLSFLDWGLNPGQDNSATTSCKQADRKPHGRLRASNLTQGIGEGDRLTANVKAGDTLNLAFFGTKNGDRLRLYFNTAPCNPAIAIGPVLPTIADGDGDGSYIRINANWPSGFGGQTFRFSAVWGNAACSNPGVGFTNCITVIVAQDPTFGVCDDGTMESGWVVQIPSGSSDYFNNNYGDGSAQNGVTGLTISVLDFVTAVPAYPTTGVSNANTGVDPSGNTPDISGAGLLAQVSPFTFPSGTFATTSGQFISHAVSVPGSSLGSDVHGWLQFPPGDSGFLGCGADTSSGTNGCSFFSLDGYSSPAFSFFTNWGIRLNTN